MTDHRAEAERLWAEDDARASYHLLAAIHDLLDARLPKPPKIAWGQPASITAKAIEHEKAWLRLQAVTTDVDLIDALGRYVASGVTAHDVERLIYSAACDPDPEPETVTVTLPRDVVGFDLRGHARLARRPGHDHNLTAAVLDALADALGAANGSQP